jgi:hypothetical protein
VVEVIPRVWLRRCESQAFQGAKLVTPYPDCAWCFIAVQHRLIMLFQHGAIGDGARFPVRGKAGGFFLVLKLLEAEAELLGHASPSEKKGPPASRWPAFLLDCFLTGAALLLQSRDLRESLARKLARDKKVGRAEAARLLPLAAFLLL